MLLGCCATGVALNACCCCCCSYCWRSCIAGYWLGAYVASNAGCCCFAVAVDVAAGVVRCCWLASVGLHAGCCCLVVAVAAAIAAGVVIALLVLPAVACLRMLVWTLAVAV